MKLWTPEILALLQWLLALALAQTSIQREIVIPKSMNLNADASLDLYLHDLFPVLESVPIIQTNSTKEPALLFFDEYELGNTSYSEVIPNGECTSFIELDRWTSVAMCPKLKLLALFTFSRENFSENPMSTLLKVPDAEQISGISYRDSLKKLYLVTTFINKTAIYDLDWTTSSIKTKRWYEGTMPDDLKVRQAFHQNRYYAVLFSEKDLHSGSLKIAVAAVSNYDEEDKFEQNSLLFTNLGFTNDGWQAMKDCKDCLIHDILTIRVGFYGIVSKQKRLFYLIELDLIGNQIVPRRNLGLLFELDHEMDDFSSFKSGIFESQSNLGGTKFEKLYIYAEETLRSFSVYIYPSFRFSHKVKHLNDATLMLSLTYQNHPMGIVPTSDQFGEEVASKMDKLGRCILMNYYPLGNFCQLHCLNGFRGLLKPAPFIRVWNISQIDHSFSSFWISIKARTPRNLTLLYNYTISILPPVKTQSEGNAFSLFHTYGQAGEAIPYKYSKYHAGYKDYFQKSTKPAEMRSFGNLGAGDSIVQYATVFTSMCQAILTDSFLYVTCNGIIQQSYLERKFAIKGFGLSIVTNFDFTINVVGYLPSGSSKEMRMYKVRIPSNLKSCSEELELHESFVPFDIELSDFSLDRERVQVVDSTKVIFIKIFNGMYARVTYDVYKPYPVVESLTYSRYLFYEVGSSFQVTQASPAKYLLLNRQGHQQRTYEENVSSVMIKKYGNIAIVSSKNGSCWYCFFDTDNSFHYRQLYVGNVTSFDDLTIDAFTDYTTREPKDIIRITSRYTSFIETEVRIDVPPRFVYNQSKMKKGFNEIIFPVGKFGRDENLSISSYLDIFPDVPPFEKVTQVQFSNEVELSKFIKLSYKIKTVAIDTPYGTIGNISGGVIPILFDENSPLMVFFDVISTGKDPFLIRVTFKKGKYGPISTKIATGYYGTSFVVQEQTPTFSSVLLTSMSSPNFASSLIEVRKYEFQHSESPEDDDLRMKMISSGICRKIHYYEVERKPQFMRTFKAPFSGIFMIYGLANSEYIHILFTKIEENYENNEFPGSLFLKVLVNPNCPQSEVVGGCSFSSNQSILKNGLFCLMVCGETRVQPYKLFFDESNFSFKVELLEMTKIISTGNITAVSYLESRGIYIFSAEEFDGKSQIFYEKSKGFYRIDKSVANCGQYWEYDDFIVGLEWKTQALKEKLGFEPFIIKFNSEHIKNLTRPQLESYHLELEADFHPEKIKIPLHHLVRFNELEDKSDSAQFWLYWLLLVVISLLFAGVGITVCLCRKPGKRKKSQTIGHPFTERDTDQIDDSLNQSLEEISSDMKFKRNRANSEILFDL